MAESKDGYTPIGVVADEVAKISAATKNTAKAISELSVKIKDIQFHVSKEEMDALIGKSEASEKSTDTSSMGLFQVNPSHWAEGPPPKSYTAAVKWNDKEHDVLADVKDAMKKIQDNYYLPKDVNSGNYGFATGGIIYHHTNPAVLEKPGHGVPKSESGRYRPLSRKNELIVQPQFEHNPDFSQLGLPVTPSTTKYVLACSHPVSGIVGYGICGVQANIEGYSMRKFKSGKTMVEYVVFSSGLVPCKHWAPVEMLDPELDLAE